MTNPIDNEPGFLVRLIVLEKQVENLEKANIKATEIISELTEKINNIKYQCQTNNLSKTFVVNTERDLKDLEEKVATIKMDISEISIFKKLGWLVISFIIISILGFILNSSVFNRHPNNEDAVSSEDIGKKLDDISEKLSKEYKK